MKNGVTLPHPRHSDLVTQEIGAELLIYDLRNNHAHGLNLSAATIWKGCGERLSYSEIRVRLENEIGIAVDDDFVELALNQLYEFDLLQPRERSGVSQARVTRREVLKKYIIAALPAITTIVAPLAINAVSCRPAGAACTVSAECCSGVCINGTTCA